MGQPVLSANMETVYCEVFSPLKRLKPEVGATEAYIDSISMLAKFKLAHKCLFWLIKDRAVHNFFPLSATFRKSSTFLFQ